MSHLGLRSNGITSMNRAGAVMEEAIKAMRAYRTRLLREGRPIEARAVRRCIDLAKGAL